VVFVGPYEHHSNELPWRETIADVVVIAEDADGHIDLADLDHQLTRFAGRPLRIGSFSAASNVTGILTDTGAVARLLHARGALSFWDYAAGPYVPIRVAASAPGAGDHKDAVFLSPHKVPGRPADTGSAGGAPGPGPQPRAHRARRRHGRVRRPARPPLPRRPGCPRRGRHPRHRGVDPGRPGVRPQAGDRHRAHRRPGEALWQRALHRWAANPQIEILGSHQARRLAVISFRVRHGPGRYLHHNFVVALLNDLFGIQARSSCSCAGPYGHRLLAISPSRSHALREDRPWLRWCQARLDQGELQLLTSAATAGYLTDAVNLLATAGNRLLPEYQFDPHTELWRHARGPAQLQARLAAIGYSPDGEMTYPRHRDRPGRRGRFPRLPGSRRPPAGQPPSPSR
jgi:hypothetical protein